MRRSFLLLASVLIATSCESGNDQDQNTDPKITVVQPVDSFGHEEAIPVDLRFTDDRALESAEITLGTQTGGNIAYHYSMRGLSGTSDDLSFTVDIPFTINAIGENYILVKSKDADGNETLIDEPFTIYLKDDIKPTVDVLNVNGVLTNSPSVLFEVYFQVSDNLQLSEANVELETSSGAILATKTFTSSVSQMAKTAAFPGNGNYQTGTEFRAKVSVTDQAGNQAFAYSNSQTIQ